MNTHADKTQENKSQSVSNLNSQIQSSSESTFQFVDNRPEADEQRKLQKMANNSPQALQLRAFQDMANNNPLAKQVAQLQTMADNHIAKKEPIQKKENNTGLPDILKTGMENLSGLSLDDVMVHRNSDKPAQLQAHAYAQGTDIHIASGQEKHLPHEAWHVVQQKQGRVKPTMQMKGKENVNDDAGLEKEADIMGLKAFSIGMESPPIESPNEKQRISTKTSVLQRQTGSLSQKTDKLPAGTRVEILRIIGMRFRIKDLATEKTYWISGELKDFFSEDGAGDVLEHEAASSTPVAAESPPPVKEKRVETVAILNKQPKPEEVIAAPVEEEAEVVSTESADMDPVALGDTVTMKVTPKPTLAAPVAGSRVFESGGGDVLKVEVSRNGGKETIDLKAGQKYLNDSLSATYYNDESQIKPGKVTYGMFGGAAVLGDGHHRFLWMAHHNKSVQAQVKRIAGGQGWNDMKYQPDPKKPKKPYMQESGSPVLDIESADLEGNNAANQLRSKWGAINWGELKKPGLVMSLDGENLTTTAQYNVADHTIKLNKDEIDPVKLWDNVLFEAQNALNAKVFDDLVDEKGGKSATTFSEYGTKMATAEYNSVDRYVTALRELIAAGLPETSLTTLAINNIAKWKAWDEAAVPEDERIAIFNNTPHSAEESKKDTKAALSSAELYAYEAVEGSLLKNIKGKMTLILKEIFSNSASNGYYMKNQFSTLKQIVTAGPIPWPKTGAERVAKYSAWLERVKATALSIQDQISMSGTGVSGSQLSNFKQQFIEKIDSAALTQKSVDIAEK